MPSFYDWMLSNHYEREKSSPEAVKAQKRGGFNSKLG